MLARVDAAASGIKEYLETGRKKGREHDRDLIDERIPLEGNIELLDAVIDAIETKQDGDARYLHITLGFAEQFTSAEACGPGQINVGQIREVVAAYKKAVMAAYHASEYLFYAEAHIPKVTHELNVRSGEYETRLPHVHIVIPYRNLESDRYLNPFGYMPDFAVRDAIQEQINQRFGLRSPKISRRDPSALQHPLGRHASSYEGMSPKQIRAHLTNLVVGGRVNTFDELVAAASEIGDVSVRQGKDGQYVNVKPAWAERGINLKGLDRGTFGASALKLRTVPAESDVDAVVKQWEEQGAFEARYVVSKRMQAEYRAMSPGQRHRFIAARRVETDQRLALRDRPVEQQMVDAAGVILEKALARIEEKGVPTPHRIGHFDQIQLFLEGLKNGKSERAIRGAAQDLGSTALHRADLGENSAGDGSSEPGGYGQAIGEVASASGSRVRTDQKSSWDCSDTELKTQTDANLVLGAAEARYGIDGASYSTGTGRDGSPRIVHAGKQYNLADFFTKHLNTSWVEARPILASCHAQTLALATTGHHDATHTGADRPSDRSSENLLRLAGEAVERCKELAADAAKAARAIQHRDFGAALEATLRGLREDRQEDQGRLSLQATIESAGAAIARASVMAQDTEALRAALAHRDLALTLSAALHRLTVVPPRERRSRTVIEALADSARGSSFVPERLRSETNPVLVLTAAERLYGIDLTQFSIGTGADGTPRIIHKKKQYNLGDFLTKHLERPWAEAEGVLRDCFHATNADALPPPDKVMWGQFNQWRAREIEGAAAHRSANSKGFRERVLKTREDYEERKEAAKALPGQARAAAVAKARAEQFIEQQVIAADRAKAGEGGRIPHRNAHYRKYLTDLSSQGDTSALAELRRMAPHEENLEAKISGERSQPVFPLPTYSVDAKGAVTYRSGNEALVRDSVQGVSVLKAEQGAYDAAIRVAIARYGSDLKLTGDAIFVRNVVAAAQRTGLKITLRDAERPDKMPTFIRGRGQEHER